LRLEFIARSPHGMKALLLVSLAAGLWGTVGVASRLMTGQPPLDPTLAGLTRTALGGLCLLAIAAAVGLPRPGLRPLPLVALAVFSLAGAVFQICLFAAYDTVGVTVTVAVTVAGPAAVVALADAAWSRRLPDPGPAAAIALATAGVVLALVGRTGIEALTSAASGGAALLAAAVMAFAAVAVAARRLGTAMHPLQGAGAGLLGTALVLSAVALARGQGGFAGLAAMPLRDFAILGYTGLIATGGAYLAFTLGMRLSSSPTMGIAPTLIEPGVAAILAALVLGERLSSRETAGCGLMLAAIVLLAAGEWRVLVRDRPTAP
jgi:drug/metabolite transporter, DME family